MAVPLGSTPFVGLLPAYSPTFACPAANPISSSPSQSLSSDRIVAWGALVACDRLVPDVAIVPEQIINRSTRHESVAVVRDVVDDARDPGSHIIEDQVANSTLVVDQRRDHRTSRSGQLPGFRGGELLVGEDLVNTWAMQIAVRQSACAIERRDDVLAVINELGRGRRATRGDGFRDPPV